MGVVSEATVVWKPSLGTREPVVGAVEETLDPFEVAASDSLCLRLALFSLAIARLPVNLRLICGFKKSSPDIVKYTYGIP